jgi:hypothetical protein
MERLRCTRHHALDHFTNKKQLESFSIMARNAIVTYKLMLFCFFVLKKLYGSVAKFDVYFHRKEFRRKKPFRNASVPPLPIILSN